MGKFTRPYKNREGTLESCEWDHVFFDRPTDTSIPRVFYIGDSISGSTFPVANRMLNGEMLIDNLYTSKAIDNPFLKDVIALAGAQMEYRELVVFNNGIHGWFVSTEDYEIYYRDTVRFLIEEFAPAPVALITTTHLRDEEEFKRIAPRNEIVRKIAKEFDLPVIDYEEYALAHMDLLSPDGVHFTDYSGFAELLIKRIREILAERK